MNSKIILAVLLVAMLFFGCIGGEEQKSNQSNTTAPSTQASNTSQGSGGNASASDQTSNQSDSQGGSSQTDLIGKGWTELVSLGVPVECEITYKDTDTASNLEHAVIYLKGGKFKEVVDVTEDGKSMTMTIISKNDGYVYMKYGDPEIMAAMTQGKISCDGIKYSTNVSTTEDIGTGASSDAFTDTSDLEDEAKVELKCKPGIFGDEMFSTAGKYCTMKEITTAAYGDVCAQITDPQQKAQCEAALGD